MKLVVAEDLAGRRLDRFLAASLPGLSRAVIMKYLKEGEARLNGRRARPGLFVRAGDTVELPGFEEATERIRGGRAAGMPELPPAREGPAGVDVLYEDEHLIVVSKPPGLVMHPGKEHEGEGLDVLLREHFGGSVRLVHRIDRDTSGVVVAARGHPVSARRMVEAFREGDVEKVYVALVRGVPDPPDGVVDAPLLDTKVEGARVHVDPHGKPAVTAYRTLETFGGRFALLELRPRTGRRHQIRAHLAHLGHPLAIDHVYARKRRLNVRELRPDLPVTWKNPVILTRQPLHAASITLRHPKTGEEMTFTAPLPEDLRRALELLRGS